MNDLSLKAEVPDIGIIVARFQSPYLHGGHKELLSFVFQKHLRTIVFLGVSPLKSNSVDPYDFPIRKMMIEKEFPDIEIYPLNDVGDDLKWSRSLDKAIQSLIGPSQKVVLYGSRDSFKDSYYGIFPTEELKPTFYVSASVIRRTTGIKPKNNQFFREGIIYSVVNQYPKVVPTVDIAVISECKRFFLVGKKPDENLWRFPGGYADVNSDSYEDDAIRELKEETGLIAEEVPTYIGSFKIPDWRYLRQKDKIKTSFFVLNKYKGPPKAGDDLSEVSWMKITNFDKELIMPIHNQLICALKNYFFKTGLDR